MPFVNIFTSIVILFVAVNLAWLIYQFLNRKWREGLENASDSNAPMIPDATSCHGSNCDIVGQFCPKGVPGASTSNYLCKNKKEWEEVDSRPTETTNANKDVAGSLDSTVDKSIANNAQSTDTKSSTLDSDTAQSYNMAAQATTSCSPAQATDDDCNPITIHNEGADASTYGQWFPRKVNSLNLKQSEYEIAGRRFLNDESIKKGVNSPQILDSEAEVLGRLLWRVHIAAINQYCNDNSKEYVTATMNDELDLMKKLHSIQSSPCPSSLTPAASKVPSSTCPQESTTSSTTGVMTDTRPTLSDNISSTQQYDLSNQASASAYTNTYKPRDPSLKPKPYNSIYDIF